MATFVWALQGTTSTEIADTDKLQFAGGTFDSKITVGEYNKSTHVKDDAGDDKSAGRTPKNNRYVTISTVSVNEASPINLNTITTAECTLKIRFSDTGVITEDAIFYAYDGTTPATPPANIDFKAAEQGDTNWTTAEGNGAALALEDQGEANDHDFFIAVSASPDTIGKKEGNKIRIELTYS